MSLRRYGLFIYFYFFVNRNHHNIIMIIVRRRVRLRVHHTFIINIILLCSIITV